MFDQFRKKKVVNEQIKMKDETSSHFNDGSLNEVESKERDEKDIQQHGKHYSEDGLWSKIKKYAKKAGSSAVYAVLLLYFVLQKEDVPKRDKAIIVGALGYFIFPLDLIPDLTPGVGYTDDIGTLIFALLRVSVHIDYEVKNKAKSKLKDFFGEGIDTSDIDDKLV